MLRRVAHAAGADVRSRLLASARPHLSAASSTLTQVQSVPASVFSEVLPFRETKAPRPSRERTPSFRHFDNWRDHVLSLDSGRRAPLVDEQDMRPALTNDPKAPIGVRVVFRKIKGTEVDEFDQPLPHIMVGHFPVVLEATFIVNSVATHQRVHHPDGTETRKPHKGENRVRAWFKLGETGLSERAQQVVRALVGTRYDAPNDLVRLTAKRFPTREENYVYLGKLLKKLVREAQLYDGPVDDEATAERARLDQEEQELRQSLESL